MNHVHESSAVGDEYRRREGMLAKLRALPGAESGFTPESIGQVGMSRGEQGIFFDKASTHQLAKPGVTVSLKVTGRVYEDTVAGDSIIYRYPMTDRSPGRDEAEIQATKNAGHLSLPVFTIFPKGKRRTVIRSWVEDWDDRQASFLLFLDREGLGARDAKTIEQLDTSSLTLKPTPSRTSTNNDSDDYFRFRVLKAYGSSCSCCTVNSSSLIHAVRIIEKSFTGRNSVLNGLPMCPTHKAALDEGLLTLDIENNIWIAPSGREQDLEGLGVTHRGIGHLTRAPSPELLEIRFGANQNVR